MRLKVKLHLSYKSDRYLGEEAKKKKSFLHLEQRKLIQKGLVLYKGIRSQIPLVPTVVAKR